LIDFRHFLTALQNLVANAIKATATQVHLSAKVTSEGILVTVWDNGPGIPIDIREDAFKVGVSGRGSSGLGLAMVMDVVKAADPGATVYIKDTITQKELDLLTPEQKEYRKAHGLRDIPGTEFAMLLPPFPNTFTRWLSPSFWLFKLAEKKRAAKSCADGAA